MNHVKLQKKKSIKQKKYRIKNEKEKIYEFCS